MIAKISKITSEYRVCGAGSPVNGGGTSADFSEFADAVVVPESPIIRRSSPNLPDAAKRFAMVQVFAGQTAERRCSTSRNALGFLGFSCLTERCHKGQVIGQAT